MTETLESVDLYRKAILIRSVEQRLLELFAQGKLFGTVHTCIGQEWTGVAVAEALLPGDLIFTNHRGHGHYLARTGDVEGLIAEVMGKTTGMCGGRGGSQHMCSGGVFSNGIQGGIVPVATGLALSQKIQGKGNLTVCFIGDGTLGEGALYEAMNIASKWQLPLLIVVENNRYSQSTSQHTTLSGDILARAAAFDIHTAEGETWDPPSLVSTTQQCVEYVRTRNKPAFLRIDTYRLMAHSKGDDDRNPTEVKDYWAKDPLTVFSKENAEESTRLSAEVKQLIDEAVARADAAPYSSVPVVDDDVPAPHETEWTETKIEASERVVIQIHAGLKRNMERDPRLLLIGEDIEGPYGGAFKVTKNLSLEFPGRVRNTPISEAAIVGIGNGLGLGGMVPVCEIMFGDFLMLAGDQLLNHASKFRHMYNDQVQLPLVVRTPMGGKRGYGPTHSQSIEKHFLGMPGTRMLAVSHRFDPAVLYDRIFATIDRPTIVIENKLLYGVIASAKAPQGFVWEHSNDTFPVLRLRPEGNPDLTILCYGGMLPDVEAAVETLFDEHEIIAEIICPTQLYPLDPWPIINSVRSSGRLLVVEEGLAFAAFGAEAITEMMERVPGVLQSVRRLASPRHPIPSCGPLEKALLPNPARIVATAVELMKHG